VFISIGMAGVKNEIDYPVSCSPRSQIGCDFINWLYGSYGSNAVGALFLVVAGFILFSAVSLIRNPREKT